jgi:hypothetical protein
MSFAAPGRFISAKRAAEKIATQRLEQRNRLRIFRRPRRDREGVDQPCAEFEVHGAKMPAESREKGTDAIGLERPRRLAVNNI